MRLYEGLGGGLQIRGVFDPHLVAHFNLLTTQQRTQQMAFRQPHDPYMRSSTHPGQLHNGHPRHPRRPEAGRQRDAELLSRAWMCCRCAYGGGEAENEDHQGRRSTTSHREA